MIIWITSDSKSFTYYEDDIPYLSALMGRLGISTPKKGMLTYNQAVKPEITGSSSYQTPIRGLAAWSLEINVRHCGGLSMVLL